MANISYTGAETSAAFYVRHDTGIDMTWCETDTNTDFTITSWDAPEPRVIDEYSHRALEAIREEREYLDQVAIFDWDRPRASPNHQVTYYFLPPLT